MKFDHMKPIQPPSAEFCQVIAELDSLGYDTDQIAAWAVHDDSLFRRNRMQSIITLPMLAVVLSSSAESLVVREMEAIIDRGDKLIDGIARVVGVSRRSVRCLISMSPIELGVAWMDVPIELLRAVDLLPPGKAPLTRQEWAIMHRFWEGCGFPNNHSYNQAISCHTKRHRTKEHLFSGLCSAGYEASEKRLARLWNHRIERLKDVSDYFDFVERWCDTAPWITTRNQNARRFITRRLTDELLTRYSPAKLVAQSQRWHKMVNQLRKPPGGDDGVRRDQWPGLPGLPWACDDLTLVSVTNSLELHYEGHFMDHCVGSYDYKCRTGDSHIVSIRDSYGSRLSTAEISLEQTVGRQIKPIVIQHRSKGNGPAGQDSRNALEAMLVRWQEEVNQRELKALIDSSFARRKQYTLTQLADAEFFDESINDVMRETLRDYQAVREWRDQQAARFISICSTPY